MDIVSWLNSLEWVMKHVYPFPILLYALLSVILYFICSTLTSMSFIYFVISILDFIIEIRIICLRIFLLNTINISMFSLYTWTTYLSSRAANNHQVFFFLFLFFFTFKSRSYIYSSSWWIRAYTADYQHYCKFVCINKIIALLHSKQSIYFSMNLHTNLCDFFFVLICTMCSSCG